MAPHTRRGFGAIALTAGGLALAGTPAQASPRRGNKAIVLEAVARQNSGGSFYDFLHPRVRWTIVNGRTYRDKQEFLAEGAAPILDRLRTVLRMTPTSLLEEGDTVAYQFTADATALDGQPYHNDYCWLLTFRRGLIVRVHAYLDMGAVRELIERVRPPA
ncbi:ketosteroid isomerase-like protein [Saccharothrix coeruleofusca]|uniref:nuclear transport factor 2 family protein n=1 Tax=Saccharothrix coeruleofusca TaxID=33919 RepID=UPI001AE90A27|nr:nuclear transport factor 2 family protein [Saccharothrix coeruleofusca]MBP2340216.1 ketosteroid isomerase-like protein [Saccharothrix coeruleofusca]